MSETKRTDKPEKIVVGETRVWMRDPSAKRPKSLDDLRRLWLERRIVGETRTSWIAGRSADDLAKAVWMFKIDKKTLEPRRGEKIRWSIDTLENEWEDAEYIRDHAHLIAHEIRRLDADTLRKVAAAIGYDDGSRREVVQANDVPFVRMHHGCSPGSDAPTFSRCVIRSRGDYFSAFRRTTELTEAFFAERWLLAFSTSAPSSGWSAEVVSVRIETLADERQRLAVETRRVPPPRGTIQTRGFTYPWVVVSIPAQPEGREVVWRDFDLAAGDPR